MRKFKQLLLLVISITLVSCHTTGSIKQKAWKVQQGMTTEEIGQLLGKPDFRRFDGSLEQWEYQSGGIATSCKFLIIDEGGNLAASKIRNLECPSYEICLIDYGCGKFNRKIHIMEQYP